MSEINIELKRLKNSLEKLESYSSEIGKAKETAHSIIENIKKIQTSYSDSIVTLEKELNDILFMGAQYLKKHKRGPMDAFIRR